MENKDIDKHYTAFCSICGQPMPVFAKEKPSYDTVFTHTKCKLTDEYSDIIVGMDKSGYVPTFDAMSVVERACTDSYDSRQSEIDELIEALEEATRWIAVPRDQDGLVDWGSLHLPESSAYLCKMTDFYCGMPYEVALEFCSEGDFKGVSDWRPIDTPKATQLLEKYGKK